MLGIDIFILHCRLFHTSVDASNPFLSTTDSFCSRRAKTSVCTIILVLSCMEVNILCILTSVAYLSSKLNQHYHAQHAVSNSARFQAKHAENENIDKTSHIT